MTNVLTTLGWFGFAVAAVYFIIQDANGTGADRYYVRNTTNIVLVSVGLLAGGYIVKYLQRIFGFGSGRCKECGKRIDRSEMFCFDHLRSKIWETQDQERREERKLSK